MSPETSSPVLDETAAKPTEGDTTQPAEPVVAKAPRKPRAKKTAVAPSTEGAVAPADEPAESTPKMETAGINVDPVVEDTPEGTEGSLQEKTLVIPWDTIRLDADGLPDVPDADFGMLVHMGGKSSVQMFFQQFHHWKSIALMYVTKIPDELTGHMLTEEEFKLARDGMGEIYMAIEECKKVAKNTNIMMHVGFFNELHLVHKGFNVSFFEYALAEAIHRQDEVFRFPGYKDPAAYGAYATKRLESMRTSESSMFMARGKTDEMRKAMEKNLRGSYSTLNVLPVSLINGVINLIEMVDADAADEITEAVVKEVVPKFMQSFLSENAKHLFLRSYLLDLQENVEAREEFLKLKALLDPVLDDLTSLNFTDEANPVSKWAQAKQKTYAYAAGHKKLDRELKTPLYFPLQNDEVGPDNAALIAMAAGLPTEMRIIFDRMFSGSGIATLSFALLAYVPYAAEAFMGGNLNESHFLRMAGGNEAVAKELSGICGEEQRLIRTRIRDIVAIIAAQFIAISSKIVETVK